VSACNCCEPFPTFSGAFSYQPYVLKLEGRSKSFGAGPFYYEDENGDYFKTKTETDTWKGGPGTILYADVSNQGLDYYGEIDFGSTTQRTYTYAWINCQVEGSASGFYFDERGDTEVTTQYSNPFNWPSEAVINAQECLASSEFGEWADVGSVETSKVLNTGYAETVSEYRVKHPPTATGYLKVWLSKVDENYSPEGELVSSSTQPFTTYEWSGAPPSLNHSINSLENLITSQVFEATPPESYSVVRKIVISKWSMLPEYEPDDPVSLELVFAPYSHTRPVPDCLSNGVPTLNDDCPFPE
jgi:hypothetical protein